MSLTHDDLHEISELLDLKLDEKLAPIHQVLDEHTKILSQHTEILSEHSKILAEHTEILTEHTKTLKKQGKTLDEHSKDLRKVKKDQKLILNTLDREQMRQRARLDAIEDRLGMATSVV